MKTRLAAAFLFLGSCSALRADLDIREITPDLVEMLGWKVEAHEKEGYVQFTLQLPARLLSDGRTAHLSVWRDRHLVTACILGLHKRKDGDRYEFSVSRQYLKDSSFELGPKGLDEDGQYYRVYLRKFALRKTKEVPAAKE